MQTLLSRFCEEFVKVVQPILTPLNRTIEAISKAPGDSPGHGIQGNLIELRHQVELLADKVTEQQAYVLIFGPLKSGKSTLMNAIASSYVSEVSSLPAYPCMVFVQHGPKREFVISKYNGKSETFSDAQTLSDYVDAAHKKLASRIRETEAKGELFDPQQHYRGAIRRIDVMVPAGALEKSGAVMVDTPGLYSRMKFGYDRMTRDFRDAAACAIFVVRSDNLFLEQVFDEFNRLLEMFSRIFLLVNIDTNKRDLDPHGKLVPSLEQKDPRQVIDAFENLAMSAPLKSAAEDGRLKIYPLDLLNAACGRLAADDAGATTDGAARAKSADDPGRDFDVFVDDLTEYLNSTDYLVAFLGDSLRRATALLGECKVICNHTEVRAIERRIADLRENERDAEARIAALDEIAGFSWKESFHALQREVAATTDPHAKGIGEKTRAAIDTAIDHWFRSTGSLQDLVKGDLVSLMTKFQEELTLSISKELSEKIVHGDAGIALSREIADNLTRTGLDLAHFGREAHKKTDRDALIELPPTPLKSEHLEVKKTLLDWILFRSRSAVRKAVFGPPDKPTNNIPVEQKTRRLGDVVRKEMKRRVGSFAETFFAETQKRIRGEFLGNYTRTTIDELNSGLRARRERARSEMTQSATGIAECESVMQPLAELRRGNETAIRAIEKLSTHYGQVDLYLLTQPVDAEYVVPASAPASVNGGKPGDAVVRPEPPAKPEPRPEATEPPNRIENVTRTSDAEKSS